MRIFYAMKPYYETIKNKNLYGNCLMLSPDGLPMCRCDKKKMDWYVSRKLANIITNSPMVFQLTFEPKDKGCSGKDSGSLGAYFLAPKKNRCCVCGNRKQLTRHHCVPYLYRRYFSMDIKRHNSHDIVMLCPDCHWKYEREADKLKKLIATETGIPAHGGSRENPEEFNKRKASGLVRTILRHADTIPADKLVALRHDIDALCGRKVLPDEYPLLARVSRKCGHKNRENPHSKAVVEMLDTTEFIHRWRRHFVEVMKPKFLPDYWDVDNPIKVRTKDGAHERD